MENPRYTLEPENTAGLCVFIVLSIALVASTITDNMMVGAAIAGYGLFVPLAGWIGLKIYDRIFDEPMTRAFFPAVTWRLYGLRIIGLWFLLTGSTIPIALQVDQFTVGAIFAAASLPGLFAVFFLFRGFRARLAAKDWRQAANKLDLATDLEDESSAPQIRGEYFDRPVEVVVDKEANSHFTCVSSALGDMSRGIEIASSESLYFRPHEGTVVGEAKPGAPTFRIYGVSEEIAQNLATSELFQKLKILAQQTEEMRIGPETASARQRGGALGTKELVYLVSTIAEIADMIDEAIDSADEVAPSQSSPA